MLRSALTLILALAYCDEIAASSLGDRVLVVSNSGSRASQRVAKHYMERRNIPKLNHCRISPVSDSGDANSVVAWEHLDELILRRIRKCLEKAQKNYILYIVLSYETPFLVTKGPATGGKAIDQFIADIWNPQPIGTRSKSPYFAPARSKESSYAPFESLAQARSRDDQRTVYSVWRLDGPTEQIATQLVDQAIQAEKAGLAGSACFDRRYGELKENIPDAGYSSGDWDLLRAAEFARAAGLRVIEDTNAAEFGTSPAPLRCDNAALYAGWYSYDNYNDAFTWAPGAIGWHLDSASALHPREGKNWVANALKKGITVTSGAVAEPHLDGLPHPDGIIRNLLEGANVGDAFLRNTAYLRWMIVNIGDPLYTPFPGGRAPFRTENSRD